MNVNNSKQDSLFYDIGQLIIENNNASTEFVQSIFNIDKERINDILDQLENEGVISADTGNGRMPIMLLDEYEMIFAHHFNKKSDSPAASSDNKKQQDVKSNQTTKAKKNAGCCSSCLLQILLLLILFFFVYSYATNELVAFKVNDGLKNIIGENNTYKINEAFKNMRQIIPRKEIRDKKEDSSILDQTVTIQEKTTVNAETKRITGWVQEGALYKYFDNNGNQIRNAWVNTDGDLYFLDNTGYLATSRWVEYLGNDYYVDAEGKMLSNQWINDTYYVGADGVKLKNTMTPDGYYVGVDGKYIKDNSISMMPSVSANLSIIEPVVQTNINGSDILEPISNSQTPKKEAQNYKLQSTYSHSATVYLDNDKTCNIRIQLPIFEDASGNKVVELNTLTDVECDNIITELEEMANNSIEELEHSTKYMRSINLTEGRISTQDDYSLTYRMSGKANWNNGKSEKTIVLVIYDKVDNTISYYID